MSFPRGEVGLWGGGGCEGEGTSSQMTFYCLLLILLRNFAKFLVCLLPCVLKQIHFVYFRIVKLKTFLALFTLFLSSKNILPMFVLASNRKSN